MEDGEHALQEESACSESVCSGGNMYTLTMLAEWPHAHGSSASTSQRASLEQTGQLQADLRATKNNTHTYSNVAPLTSAPPNSPNHRVSL